MTHQRAKLAVIGVGGMGSAHAREIARLPNAELTAACDLIPERAERVAGQFGCATYSHFQDLLDAERPDGVVIATPHYDHAPISIACLRQGVHVLTEKPIAVIVSDARKMIDAWQSARQDHPSLRFAIMFQMRAYPRWRKVKELLESGQLGRLVRATWIVTDWFRTQSYYDNGDWRATWRGEGGGVLLNQCPHNLDLYQWLFGMPQKVMGFVHLGKYHDIEVEDEATAYFEHPGGMVGHFITSTAESPGANRLEIVGEQGKLVIENGGIQWWRNTHSMLEHIRLSPDAYAPIEYEIQSVGCEPQEGPGHALLLRNFADAILHDEPLIAPATEGIGQIELSNAILFSGLTGQVVELPLDAAAYDALLSERIRASRFQKIVRPAGQGDISQSFRV